MTQQDYELDRLRVVTLHAPHGTTLIPKRKERHARLDYVPALPQQSLDPVSVDQS